MLADFDVKNGGFSGGGINAVTRSGTNDFAGSVFFYTRDKDFFGDGPDELGEFGEFEEDQYGFRLGGPIVQDKVFFFVNARHRRPRRRPRAGRSTASAASSSAMASAALVDEAEIFRSFLINNYGVRSGRALREQLRDDPSDKFFGRLRLQPERQPQPDRCATTTSTPATTSTGLAPSPTSGRATPTTSRPRPTRPCCSSTASSVRQLLQRGCASPTRRIKDRRAGRDGVLIFPWIEIEDVNGDGPGDFEFEAGTERFSTRNALDQDILEIHNDFSLAEGQPHDHLRYPQRALHLRQPVRPERLRFLRVREPRRFLER